MGSRLKYDEMAGGILRKIDRYFV